MSRARTLADYVAGGTTAAEFDYLDGVTSNIQTQMDAKVPKGAITTKTGTATLTTGEEGIIIANKATAFTINLPAVSGNSGLFYHIKSIGAGAVTVDGNSSETIDGQTTQVLTQWNNMYIKTNGTTWYIL